MLHSEFPPQAGDRMEADKESLFPPRPTLKSLSPSPVEHLTPTHSKSVDKMIKVCVHACVQTALRVHAYIHMYGCVHTYVYVHSQVVPHVESNYPSPPWIWSASCGFLPSNDILYLLLRTSDPLQSASMKYLALMVSYTLKP